MKDCPAAGGADAGRRGGGRRDPVLDRLDPGRNNSAKRIGPGARRTGIDLPDLLDIATHPMHPSRGDYVDCRGRILWIVIAGIVVGLGIFAAVHLLR
jgi:hypothetical protein